MLPPNNPTIGYSICFLSHMTPHFPFLGPLLDFSPCRLRVQKKIHCRQTVINKSVPMSLPPTARRSQSHKGTHYILPDRRKHLVRPSHLFAGRSYENQQEAAEEAQTRDELRLAVRRRGGWWRAFLERQKSPRTCRIRDGVVGSKMK